MELILVLLLVSFVIIFTCCIVLLALCINGGMYNDLYDMINNYINGNENRNRIVPMTNINRIIPKNNIEKPVTKENYIVIESPLNHISIGVEITQPLEI